MNAKTEELLNFLLWTAEGLVRPTLRNLTESYEGWAYRNGLLRQLARLEKQRLVERDPPSGSERFCRLTPRGRLRVLGGRDPEERWSRAWDGRWRIVLFDVPIHRNAQRDRLRRDLREKGFGYLQNSVWISPDRLDAERDLLRSGKINVESLILFEARPCAGEADAEMVAGAWNFDRINGRYLRLLRVLEQRPQGALRSEVNSQSLRRWGKAEREAWLDAVLNDPLLPRRLLPAGYLGEQAWQRRLEVLREAGRQMRTFCIPDIGQNHDVPT